jgi:hypothetical protein
LHFSCFIGNFSSPRRKVAWRASPGQIFVQPTFKQAGSFIPPHL